MFTTTKKKGSESEDKYSVTEILFIKPKGNTVDRLQNGHHQFLLSLYIYATHQQVYSFHPLESSQAYLVTCLTDRIR